MNIVLKNCKKNVNFKGKKYLKKNDVRYNTLTVVQKDNSYHPTDVYRFLKEIGEGYMQFIPITH